MRLLSTAKETVNFFSRLRNPMALCLHLDTAEELQAFTVPVAKVAEHDYRSLQHVVTSHKINM
jgi:hypothetical protein